MDWIGFVISFAALIYLFFKNQRKTIAYETFENEEVIPEDPKDNHLLDPLKSSEIRQHRPPAPPRKGAFKHERIEERHLISPLKDKKLVSEEGHRKLVSPLRTRHLQSTLVSPHDHDAAIGPSRAKILIKRLHSKQNLLVYSEIFGKPKSLQ